MPSIDPPSPTRRTSPNSSTEPTVESPNKQPRLDLPTDLSPLAIKKNQQQHKARLKEILATPEPVAEFKRIAITPTTKKRRKRKRKYRRVSPPAVGDFVEQHELSELVDERPQWAERVRDSSADRVVLARFFALSLCAVALINLFPAFYFWYDWYQAVMASPLPRWIYLQVFVAAVHVVYAVFLFQIPDWSAMRTVSLAMLAIAFVFGLVSAGLLLGGGQGEIAAFWDFPT